MNVGPKAPPPAGVGHKLWGGRSPPPAGVGWKPCVAKLPHH